LNIRSIIDNNVISELKDGIHRYHWLNRCNVILSYIFHTMQTSGIFVTTVATGYNHPEFIWLGIGLNIFAYMLNVFEKTNNNILSKISKDILSMKEGTFPLDSVVSNLETDEEKASAAALAAIASKDPVAISAAANAALNGLTTAIDAGGAPVPAPPGDSQV